MILQELQDTEFPSWCDRSIKTDNPKCFTPPEIRIEYTTTSFIALGDHFSENELQTQIKLLARPHILACQRSLVDVGLVLEDYHVYVTHRKWVRDQDHTDLRYSNVISVMMHPGN